MNFHTQDRSHSRLDREKFPVQEETPAEHGSVHASPTTHRRDLIIIVLAAVAASVIGATFDLAEYIGAWMRTHEHYEVDEWPGALLVLAAGSTWYAMRRFRDASRALNERMKIERRLSTALAENRALAQQTVRLQESERKRLARELHDELGQYLNAIKLDAVAIRDDAQLSPGATRDAAVAIVHGVDHVYAVVASMIRRLRPVGLDDLGLAAAIEQCVEYWRTRLPGTRFTLRVTGSLAGLGELTDLTVYRLVQEGLTNVSRHARATAVDISIERRSDAEEGEMLMLAIVDNGAGAQTDGPGHGFGLVGMRERVQALGGRFAIDTAPGAGFALSVQLPVAGDLVGEPA